MPARHVCQGPLKPCAEDSIGMSDVLIVLMAQWRNCARSVARAPMSLLKISVKVMEKTVSPRTICDGSLAPTPMGI